MKLEKARPTFATLVSTDLSTSSFSMCRLTYVQGCFVQMENMHLSPLPLHESAKIKKQTGGSVERYVVRQLQLVGHGQVPFYQPIPKVGLGNDAEVVRATL